MKALIRGGAIAALAITVTATSFAGNAEARRRYVAPAIIGGVVIGSLLAGAAAANARERTYVRPVRDCGEFRRNARYNEEIGRPNRAQHWWDRYYACRGE